MTGFQTALDELYATFARETPRVISGCPCCIDTKNICVLTTKPLRELSDKDLAPYGASVFLTVDGDHFRYFLPRIFEISAMIDGWWPSPEIAIGKLERASWTDWSEPEQHAVRVFLHAWLENYLTRESEYATEVDAILCGIGLSGDDLAPYLAQMKQHPEMLRALIDINTHAFFTCGAPLNLFWKQAPTRAEPLLNLIRAAN